MPRMFPKGSSTEAVMNPDSPRFVSGSYSFAPIAFTFSSAAATSSTCQYTTAPPGPIAVAPLGAYLLSMIPSSCW